MGGSAAGATFSDLQVQTDAFSIDKHGSGVNQLLTRAVIVFVAAQGGEGEEKLYGFRTCAGTGFAGQVEGGAEADAVELRVIFDVAEHGTDKVRDVVIEGQGGQFVPRSSRRL